MNGFSHQYIHSEKLRKAGQKFKPIFGIEAYFIPSVGEWTKLHDASLAASAAKKKAKKVLEAEAGNELAPTEAELDEMAETKSTGEGEGEEGGTIIENEDESKKQKFSDPIKARNHLVLLAKNDQGLIDLFRIVSDSSAEGSYNGYPRVDFDSLRKHAKGNIIGLHACVAGYLAKIIFDHQTDPSWDNWLPTDKDFELIQGKLKTAIEHFQEALGKENYYLEMQFNKLNPQHLVNMHFQEASKRTGAPLVVTADAHYSDPLYWREREIYKLLNPKFASRADDNAKKLPEKIDDLKCELYPKNAEQIWESYKHTTKDYDFYNDDIVREAIERTHVIAHEQIGSVEIDRRVKLPAISRIVEKPELDKLTKEMGTDANEDSLAFKELKRLSIEGLKSKNKTTDSRYPERLHKELGDIKYLQETYPKFKIAKYFLLYKKLINLTEDKLFVGNGRGSVSGSLTAYCLGISQVDPIKYNLLWERFISRKKLGMPDIDQDWSDREEAVKLIQAYFGEENVIPVSNFAQLQLASLCKDLAKFFGVPFDQVNKYTSKMRAEAISQAKKEPGFDATQWEFTLEVAQRDSPSYKEFMEQMETYPAFKNALEVLFKQQRTVSRHAGGVIITDNSRDNMPLIKAKGGLQTPWPEGLAARHLEDLGLLKFDILGLGTLKMFEECIRKILKKQGNKYPTFRDVRKFFSEKLHPDNNDFSDQKVFEHVYWNSHFAGIFQFCVEETSLVTMADAKNPTKQLKDIVVGDKVMSFNEDTMEFEEDTVDAVYDMGEKEVVRLTMEDGSTLELTADHQVLTTNRGWVEAQNLTEEDDMQEIRSQ